MTYKYNNVHAFMETFLDNDMIHRRMRCNPYQFDIVKYCKLVSTNLRGTINQLGDSL